MENKQCLNCKFYNSLGCPYTNPNREDDGDICDEFREAIVQKDKTNLRQLKMSCLAKGDCGRCVWDGDCEYQ